MKIYLAGKWDDREQILLKMDDLEDLGHEITHKWPIYETPEERTREHQENCARFDIDGVKTADLVIVFMDDPKYAYRGSFTELGAALAQRKPTILVCPNPNEAYCATNVFYHHPDIFHLENWDQVLTTVTIIGWYRKMTEVD